MCANAQSCRLAALWSTQGFQMTKTEPARVPGSTAIPLAPQVVALNVTKASVKCAQRSSRRETHKSTMADDTFQCLSATSSSPWECRQPLPHHPESLGNILRSCGEPRKEAMPALSCNGPVLSWLFVPLCTCLPSELRALPELAPLQWDACRCPSFLV